MISFSRLEKCFKCHLGIEGSAGERDLIEEVGEVVLFAVSLKRIKLTKGSVETLKRPFHPKGSFVLVDQQFCSSKTFNNEHSLVIKLVPRLFFLFYTKFLPRM